MKRAGEGNGGWRLLASPGRGGLFPGDMDLATAQAHIQNAVDRMRAAYRQPVFDEWAILSLASQNGGVLAYAGPRPQDFRRLVPRDAEPLRAITAGRQFADGDIEFVPDAADTHYDAFMKVGPASYLILNHTVKTMNEIRADAKWLAAQTALFQLSEKFREDPLAV